MHDKALEHHATHIPSMKDKIQALLAQIKQDFPHGCGELECTDCPLASYRESVTQESAICDMLSMLEFRRDYQND